MVSSLRFEWGPRKAAANRAKHGVSFEEARSAFADDGALVVADPEHSDDEDRFVLMGIISARRANSRERERYSERNSP